MFGGSKLPQQEWQEPHPLKTQGEEPPKTYAPLIYLVGARVVTSLVMSPVHSTT